LVISDNDQGSFQVPNFLTPKEDEWYPPAYAFSTEAKRIESLDTHVDSNVIPIEKTEVQNISRNKIPISNIVPEFKNNNIINIIDDSSYSNLNLTDEYGNVESNNSIVRITNQVRKNIKSAKEDFDNFLRRTENSDKLENSQENFKNNDIITETTKRDDESPKINFSENNSSQISEKNMTSNKGENDDEKIERESSYDKDRALSPTYHDRSMEDTYNTTHVTNNTEDFHTSIPVKTDPMYGDVERSTKITTPSHQEELAKEILTNANSKLDHQELDNTKITSNEDEYKNILLSIISSLNKLDVSTNSNDHITTQQNSSSINQIDNTHDTILNLEGLLPFDKIAQDDPSDQPSSSDSSKSSSSASSSVSSNSSTNSSHKVANSAHKDRYISKLSDSKICSQALIMIKFLGTLNMKKLDLKHEPRLRRASFLEWISQLEIAFSSNKYTRTILSNYSINNKINLVHDEKIDLLVYTVIYAFLDKPTRISTLGYKNKGTKLLKVLHLKCASIDAQTKLRAKLAFINCRISNEETAINFLTRLEQKANEARNFDIKISERKFIWTLLHNMKFHRHYKERIASFLTAFELDKNSITQKWIENKFYSMDEERMSFHRQRLFKESARFTSSNSTQQNNSNKKRENSNKKIIRCRYCYRCGHTDETCMDRKQKRPPSMPSWVSKTTCLNCKKKGHLAFNCPPKYAYKIIRPKIQNFQNNKNKTTANNVKDESNQTPKMTEFAGMATSLPSCPKIQFSHKKNTQNNRFMRHNQPYSHERRWNHRDSYQYHKKKLNNISRSRSNDYHKDRFYHLLLKKNGNNYLQPTISHEIRKLNYNNQISLLWLLSYMNRYNQHPTYNQRKMMNTKDKNEGFHKTITPPRSNISRRHVGDKAKRSTFAFSVEHETLARNYLPASDLEKGWVIDSGASAHMTPFRKDCKNVQTANRKIFLADGSAVLCKEMGTIEIPILDGHTKLGILRLDNVLIVPSLDRRLFSVNSFLQNGNNWVHFENSHIHLGIKDGPKIKIPISSLQSNALVVGELKPIDKSNKAHGRFNKKVKLTTNVLHDRFHRSDGALATIKAHDLWEDVHIIPGNDSICTSCKIMTIPAASRGKIRNSQPTSPLEEIQIDTVPNPEPLGLSSESRYNYFLILCDRFSRTFRLIGIQDKSTDACIDGIELLTSRIPNNKRKIRKISHIRTDAGSEFRSDTFRKWCSENNIRCTTAAPKHQEQNGLVERHWGTILKMANTMIIHARLSKKFFYYAIKYAQYMHDVIPVKDLNDENGLPCTPYQLINGRKPSVRQFRVFGCPAIFKRYEISEGGKRIKNKYVQQGIRAIFVGFPDDSSGWLFYVPSTKRTYISIDAVFDENFTSPLSMPDLPFQGALKLRGTTVPTLNTETLSEVTGPPIGEEDNFPNDLIETPQRENRTSRNDHNVLICHEEHPDTQAPNNAFKTLDNQNNNKIKAYFTEMSKPTDLPYSEYLHIAHDLSGMNKCEDRIKDHGINLADFLPEPKSLSQVLRMPSYTKDKWGDAIRTEITGLFDSGTFSLNEKPLPADEVIPTKLAMKAKLNSYGGLDKLKARICLRGDMQIKDVHNIQWSPTASSRLLKCVMADSAQNRTLIHQLDFIQAFIQSDTKKRMFVLLDKEYETFCPNLAGHLGRPLLLKKCLYGADFSGKRWYETLDSFLTNDLHFVRSRVEGCLYVLRKGDLWIKLINYVDDALYYSNNNEFRESFEKKLKKRFSLSLLGQAKWYLGMRIKQTNEYITLDQDQYIKKIVR